MGDDPTGGSWVRCFFSALANRICGPVSPRSGLSLDTLGRARPSNHSYRSSTTPVPRQDESRDANWATDQIRALMAW